MASTIRESSVVGVAIMLGSVELVENLFDPVLSGDGIVVDEDDLWRAPQAQPLAELAPEEWRRAFEGAATRGSCLLVAQGRIQHTRLLEIRGDLHPRERDEANARIVHVAGEQIGELTADLVGDSVRTRSLGHYAVIATRSLM